MNEKKVDINIKQHKELWIILGIFTLALAIRLLYLYGASEHPTFKIPIVDSGKYHSMAKTLASGSLIDQESFWQVFFYPLVLSWIYSIFDSSIVAAKIIQILIGAFTCVLTFQLGKKIFDLRTGIVAGVIAIFYGPLIYFEGEILATGLAAFCAVLYMLFLLKADIKSKPWFFFITGLTGGFCVITRITFFPFLILSFVWIIFSLYRTAPKEIKKVALNGALIVIGFCIVTGYTARKNESVTGRFTFLPETGPLNLYMGNNSDMEDIMAIRPGPDWDLLLNEPIRKGAKSRNETRAYFMDKFWDYVRSEPIHFTHRMARKAVHLLSSREIPSNMDPYYMRNYSSVLSALMWKAGNFGFPYGLLLPLVLVAIFLFRSKIPVHVYLFLFIYSGAIILVFVNSRFRAPMIPIMIPLAAASLTAIVDMFSKRKIVYGAGLVASVALIGVLTSLAGPFGAEATAGKIDYNTEMEFCLGVEYNSLNSD